MFDSDLTLTLPSDRDNNLYQVISGAAQMQALQTFLDLKIPELLGNGWI